MAVASHLVRAFVRDHTRVCSAGLCPEIRLYLADDMDTLWKEQESLIGRTGFPPPFWCLPWIGGQALARYILDHPTLVSNRSVLDVGPGSGICAVAAAKSGADSVDAYDIDVFSRDVLTMNARINNVRITSLSDDVIGSPSRWDIVLVGDLWYERFLAQRLNTWLQSIARAGTLVLVGDCGRAFFPRQAATERDQYAVAAHPSTERGAVTITRVWQIH
jgi:predicted nicotinamide N-methyase